MCCPLVTLRRGLKHLRGRSLGCTTSIRRASIKQKPTNSGYRMSQKTIEEDGSIREEICADESKAVDLATEGVEVGLCE